LFGVFVLVLVGVFEAVPPPPMLMGVFVLVIVIVAVIETVLDGVNVLLGITKEVFVGVGVLDINGVYVSVGNGGTFVQVGGN
jgi:hypothetical protein